MGKALLVLIMIVLGILGPVLYLVTIGGIIMLLGETWGIPQVYMGEFILLSFSLIALSVTALLVRF